METVSESTVEPVSKLRAGLGLQGSRRKDRGVLNLRIASSAGNSERQSFVRCPVQCNRYSYFDYSATRYEAQPRGFHDVVQRPADESRRVKRYGGLSLRLRSPARVTCGPILLVG
ncbi:hypothetical protein EVAR_102822_1 [Eumeta japonica]|uniref:Uncharacterized protein n=1 Tax=Eumeta variegata TaxID=151549 RepID=A0A4C1TL98_EUMVA|nr:hypothetical protein EVAR_102822_1 [Eumeta japonica]